MKAGILTLACIFSLGFIPRPLFQSFILRATSNKAEACLELLGNTTTEENATAYIVGTVRNNCDRTFGSVTVTFKLDRGASDTLPEYSISAYARNVEPGQIKQFKTVTPISRNSTYRFDRISAF